MTHRFLVAVDDASAEQQNAVTAALKDAGMGFWHYFSDIWLVIDTSDHGIVACRDLVMQAVPGATIMVLDFPHGSGNHAGFAKPTIWAWIKSQWRPHGGLDG